MSSSSTIYLADNSSTYIGSNSDGETVVGNNEQIGDGASANFTLSGTGDTVSGGGYNTVNIDSNSTATVNGGNDTINIAAGSNNSVVTESSGNDTVNIGGSYDTLYTTSGNSVYVASNDEDVTITGNGQTIGDGAYATFTISGTGDTISGGGWNNIYVDGESTATVIGGNENVTIPCFANDSTVTINNNNDNIQISGSDDTVFAYNGGTFNVTDTTQNNFIYANSAVIKVGNGVKLVVSGTGDDIIGGNQDNISAYGYDFSISDNNSSDLIVSRDPNGNMHLSGTGNVYTIKNPDATGLPGDPGDPSAPPVGSTGDNNSAEAMSSDEVTVSAAAGGLSSEKMRFTSVSGDGHDLTALNASPAVGASSTSVELSNVHSNVQQSYIDFLSHATENQSGVTHFYSELDHSNPSLVAHSIFTDTSGASHHYASIASLISDK